MDCQRQSIKIQMDKIPITYSASNLCFLFFVVGEKSSSSSSTFTLLGVALTETYLISCDGCAAFDSLGAGREGVAIAKIRLKIFIVSTRTGTMDTEALDCGLVAVADRVMGPFFAAGVTIFLFAGFLGCNSSSSASKKSVKSRSDSCHCEFRFPSDYLE